MAESMEQAGSVSGGVPAEHLVYQPLSLLAVAGFGLALLYAVVVLLGFVSSVLIGSPWLMPIWTMVFPVLAGTLSLTARGRILRSEGTLAGLALARWGATLSLLAALIYASHSIATYIYLKREAESFTRQWFAHLTEGKVDEAFVLTLPPANRPPLGTSLRDTIENRFNTPGENSRRGLYSEFTLADWFRLIRIGGTQTEIQMLGLGQRDYARGGYQVEPRFRVTTPDCIFEIVVPVHGLKSQTKESQGREWQVIRERVEIVRRESTGRGLVLFQLGPQAQGFAHEWIELLRKGGVEAAYLNTREPEKRVELDQVLRQRIRFMYASAPLTAAGNPMAGVSAVAAYLSVPRELGLPGYTEFAAGSLVSENLQDFWPADEKTRTEILAEVRRLFQQPGDMLGPAIDRENVLLIPWVVRERTLEFRQDVTLTIGRKYRVDGWLVLTCDASALDAKEGDPPPAWRVAGLELVRAREIPANAPLQRGGPQMLP